MRDEAMLAAGWKENPVWAHYMRNAQPDGHTRMGHRMFMILSGVIGSVVGLYFLDQGDGWTGFIPGAILLGILESIHRIGQQKDKALVNEKYPRYICAEDARHVPTYDAWCKAYEQLISPPRDAEGWLLWPAREVELAVGRAGGNIPNATSPTSRTDAEWLRVACEALDAANALLHRVYPALWPGEESDLRLARDAIQQWLSDQADLPATEEWRVRNALEQLRETYRDIVAGRIRKNSGSVIQSRATLVQTAICKAYDVREERGAKGRFKIKQDALPAEPELLPSLPSLQRRAFDEMIELLSQDGRYPELTEASIELLGLAKPWDDEQMSLPRSQAMRTSHALRTLEGECRKIVETPALLESDSTREELSKSFKAVIGLIHSCYREKTHLLELDVELGLRALRRQIEQVPTERA